MTGFDCYTLFLSLNTHFFQSSYDYFKYGGIVRTKVETYEQKRPDEKYRYERLGKKFRSLTDLENYIVASLIESKKRLWIGDLFNGDMVYHKWLGRTQSIRYNFISEVRRLLETTGDFNKMFECQDRHPEILKAQMRSDVSLETFVFLDFCVHFISTIDKTLSEDRNWTSVRLRALKYRPFLQRLSIDVPVLRTALQEVIKDIVT